MEHVEKSVFLSYRRSNVPWAIAIRNHLKQRGYDVFVDYDGIASGDFEQVIVQNIISRAHFLVLLTPSALERCDDPADWLRREIETALAHERNIVPLLLEGFDFKTPKIVDQLTGRLAALKSYNGLEIPPPRYFEKAMEDLCSVFLNVPLDAVVHPISLVAQRAAAQQKNAADAAPTIHMAELTAQQWFERGFTATDIEKQLLCYTEAIRLNPDHAEAFYQRGVVRRANDDPHGALQDFDEAIRLRSDYADAIYSRGVVRREKGDFKGASWDFKRVRGTIPHSYYVGIEPSGAGPLKALTIAPFGMKEGTAIRVSDRKFALVVGEPSEFRLFRSETRKEDVPGTVLDGCHELEELSPVEVLLDGRAGECVPVTLETVTTETGNLQLWALSPDERRRVCEVNIREDIQNANRKGTPRRKVRGNST
jgi:hypothetical protein